MGRSYGDAAQLDGGIVLGSSPSSTGSTSIASGGTVTAGAGITLGQLLHVLGPAGWMCRWSRARQHVTVGGAIASDIHGKNHGSGRDVRQPCRTARLDDRRRESVRELALDRDGELFEATLGGMGLTGVIVWATIKLRQIGGPWLAVDSDRVDGLDDDARCAAGAGRRLSRRVARPSLLASRPRRS